MYGGVKNCDGAFEGGVDGTVIGAEKRCGGIVVLAEIGAFAEDTIAPCGNTGFFAV